MKHYISLGAGVQSSTMALMAAHGEIEPTPDGAIFADTQAEPKVVYEWLDWLEKQLPFPVHRVTAGNLREAALRRVTSKSGNVYLKTAIPLFLKSPYGKSGKTIRECTEDYKIVPINAAMRRLGEVKRGTKTPEVVSWIGISTDEFQRMKPSRQPWIECRWPLIEKRISRSGCLQWMREHGYPEPPRSACTFCPFHSNREWNRLKKEDPDSFADAIDFDRAIRDAAIGTVIKGTPYLHSSMKPIESIDFRNDVDRGQMVMTWDDECTGMCGV